MFAVNGPSGPTQRNERRVKTPAEAEADRRREDDKAQRRRQQFFETREPLQAKVASADERAATHAASDIFKGCHIVFNGRTGKVSSYYLTKLVQEHGGNVSSIQMTKPSRITHMVGCNLSGSKADKTLKKLGKTKFVSPDWILQSVKQKKRLREFDFLVYKDTATAARLHAAFAPSAPTTNTNSQAE